MQKFPLKYLLFSVVFSPNTFTHADGYSRNVEFAQSAQHQFFYLVLERTK